MVEERYFVTLRLVLVVCWCEILYFPDGLRPDNCPPLCRSPLAPHARSGYREREREFREKDRSSSRDREDHYGRPTYDRPPYERSGPERYGHSASPYGMFSAKTVKLHISRT